MGQGTKIRITIEGRPWYAWLGSALWLLAELFLLQNAIMSGQEREPRAATIFWILFVLLALGAAIRRVSEKHRSI
jgi:hypothetical protein